MQNPSRCRKENGKFDAAIQAKAQRNCSHAARRTGPHHAAHPSSGVTTLIINQRGVVYQKDVGEKTSDIAVTRRIAGSFNDSE
jgi:hypothetical protein